MLGRAYNASGRPGWVGLIPAAFAALLGLERAVDALRIAAAPLRFAAVPLHVTVGFSAHLAITPVCLVISAALVRSVAAICRVAVLGALATLTLWPTSLTFRPCNTDFTCSFATLESVPVVIPISVVVVVVVVVGPVVVDIGFAPWFTLIPLECTR